MLIGSRIMDVDGQIITLWTKLESRIFLWNHFFLSWKNTTNIEQLNSGKLLIWHGFCFDCVKIDKPQQIFRDKKVI